MKRIPMSKLAYPGDGLYYLDDEPFTGFVLLGSEHGQDRGYSEYRHGLCWGETRETYPEGTPVLEATYFKGVFHGRAREWHRNGRLAEDGEYEYGIALWKKTWDEDGVIEEDYRLEQGDQDYQDLLYARSLYEQDSTSF